MHLSRYGSCYIVARQSEKNKYLAPAEPIDPLEKEIDDSKSKENSDKENKES